MPQLLKTEAIVLRRRSLLEKDVLLTVFSLEEGKITAIAKGVKKITSRRAPHLQTGNLVNFELSRRNDRWYLQQSELVSGFSALRDHMPRLNVLYVFLFVLDRILPEQAPENSVYVLTKKFIIALTRSNANEQLLLADYMNEVMQSLGYVNEPKKLTELIRFIEEIIHEKIPFRII